MKVSVIGLGYIGLPTAAIFASNGVEVIGVDIKQSTVDTINQGEAHIVEPDLNSLVQSSVKSGNLRATCHVESSDVFIIAVPTPFKDGHQPDLSFIKSALDSIVPVLKKGDLIILESTSPVGTTEMMIQRIKERRIDLVCPLFKTDGNQTDISFAYCPERVLPGKILSELVENDRIIGGVTSKCAERASKLYKIFLKGNCLVTDSRTAELSKLVENSFRDVNIAFANELSIISDKLKVNVWELIKLCNHHPRVNILQPGPGVGGHCIAVDPWFIIDSVPEQSRLIHMARLVNDSKPDFVLEKIKQASEEMDKKISNLSIACLGLSFKSDIDDLRESPALNIARQVDLMGFKKLFLVEPNIALIPDGFDNIKAELVSLDQAIKSAEIIVLLVDHFQFKEMKIELLHGKKVVDTRGGWT